jgi:hypothetical protein
MDGARCKVSDMEGDRSIETALHSPKGRGAGCWTYIRTGCLLAGLWTGKKLHPHRNGEDKKMNNFLYMTHEPKDKEGKGNMKL